MHPSSWKEMGRLLARHAGKLREQRLHVLDVGSMSVNADFPRTYREHMPPAWTYRGCDLLDGANVDFVMPGPYHIQDAPDFYDIVISGQCLEHVQLVWELMREMARVLRPAGLLIVTAPWSFHIHPYPVDCWRILPDGWSALAEWAALEVIDTHISRRDSWLVARKDSA